MKICLFITEKKKKGKYCAVIVDFHFFSTVRNNKFFLFLVALFPIHSLIQPYTERYCIIKKILWREHEGKKIAEIIDKNSIALKKINLIAHSSFCEDDGIFVEKHSTYIMLVYIHDDEQIDIGWKKHIIDGKNIPFLFSKR